MPKDESINPVGPSNPSSRTNTGGSSSKRSKSVDFRFFEDLKENFSSSTSPSSSNSPDLVFGQSLYKCILNDVRRGVGNSSSGHLTTSRGRSRAPPPLLASKHDLTLLSSITGGARCDEIVSRLIHDQNGNPPQAPMFTNKRNSVLFEALDLKNGGHKKDFLASFKSSPPQPKPIASSDAASKQNQNLAVRSEGLVPNIVKSCCRHISEFGLDVVGIFRIDSSKKRIKELKEMYDTGREVVLNESFNPNDAACLLKEYLRSLPEPLLTRELYSGFIAANSNFILFFYY